MPVADEPQPRRAQTVAPLDAASLQFAASILGEAEYTPEQQLNGRLTTQRGAEPAPAEPAAPVVEPAPRKGFFTRLLDRLRGRG